jgi:hypothetical protein
MDHEEETVFLSRRQGFVRMAICHGAQLVPAFAFNQGRSYSWLRPGPPFVPQWIVEWISRRAGK